MDELKTVFKRLSVYYLLMVINIIFCANVIPDVFPTRNLSTVYLMSLSVCLVLYYSHRVSPGGGLSPAMKALSWMGLLLILLRGIKYSAVSQIDVLARHTWYLYYVPMLLLPLFLLYISLLISPKDNARILKVWYLMLALTVILIISVLTNDLHQQVFSFREGFENWDNDYSHGWLFYAVSFWQFSLYFAAIIILSVKCRISTSKKHALIILIPFAIGTALIVLILTGNMPKLNGTYVIEFPEALIFTVATVLECCMQLGLIPTNKDYGKLFQNFSISAQITDKKGTVIYSSYSAVPLTEEQFAMPGGSRVDEHTVLHKMTIPGGFGFWQDDMTELDRLNDELADAKDVLSQEAELTRLKNELKEKQTQIEQRTLVYDTVAKRTHRQSQSISRLAEAARNSRDPAFKDACRRRITLLGAYIKRYANLTLLSRESDCIEAGEAALSFSEVLRYLNYCGIPGEFISSADCTVPSDAVLAVFEAFELLLEENYHSISGVFVNISEKENVAFKLTFEDLTGPVPEEILRPIADLGVGAEINYEDNVAYICFTVPKGGKTV